MSNFDLYKQWAERYAQRVSQGQPDKGGKGKKADSKPDAGSQPDSNATTPLVVPHTFGSASFLKGQFGKDFLKEYNARVKKDYNNASALQVLNWDDANQKVTGSNPFAVVLSNMILEKSGIRTATQAELEKIAQANTLPIKGNHYVESSLVWRSNADPNSWLALDFYDQFRGAGKPLKENTAYVLPLYGLSLRKENKAPNKLAFNLKKELLDTPLYFEAPILNSKHGSYINSSEMDAKTGLPTKVYDTDVPGKNRQLWTRNSGLSRLFLNWNLNINSNDDDLADSGEYGRVVCISGVAAAQKP